MGSTNSTINSTGNADIVITYDPDKKKEKKTETPTENVTSPIPPPTPTFDTPPVSLIQDDNNTNP